MVFRINDGTGNKSYGGRNVSEEAFVSHGKYDQLIYVAPRKNVVIVRLGDRLDENVNWALVLHNIVDQLK